MLPRQEKKNINIIVYSKYNILNKINWTVVEEVIKTEKLVF
jgi:hypothetical protein